MKRVILYVLLFGGVGLALWYALHKHDKRIDADIKAPTLTQNQQAKVIVDPRHHSVTTVTRAPNGALNTRSTYLPDSGASVTVGKDGTVLVTTRAWGTEVVPFMGFGLGSDLRPRAALGLNGLYVQRWELGGGLLVSTNIRDTRLFAQVSYNAYDNIYVALGIDNRRTAHIMAGLKF